MIGVNVERRFYRCRGNGLMETIRGCRRDMMLVSRQSNNVQAERMG